MALKLFDRIVEISSNITSDGFACQTVLPLVFLQVSVIIKL